MARGLEVGGSGSPLEKGGVVPFHWTSLERESGDVDPTPHVHPPPLERDETNPREID